MLRSIARNTVRKNIVSTSSPAAFQIRTMAGAKKRVEDAAQAAGEAKKTNPKVLTIYNSIYPLTGLDSSLRFTEPLGYLI